MHSFEQLSAEFATRFDISHFPSSPESLYAPADYFLRLGGKRVRPVMCLMGNELFGEIEDDAWHLAAAIELFHNFTLIHDDIMDKAPLRRGKPTVHEKYGASTALLAGDVMLVTAYDYINRVKADTRAIFQLFNATARAVCEGQQTDMDFESRERVGLDEYLRMIEWKTSVLLAASLQMGSILGGAGLGNQGHLYEFGKLLGLAFQIQDDYLDAFGDPAKFGKQVGGDIVAGKKTFLLIRTLEQASAAQHKEIRELQRAEPVARVEGMLRLFKACGVDAWARELKDKYMEAALRHLEDIAVLSRRKEPLQQLAGFLVQREY
ncbi:MAG: polyprenyl synthetase family protein [Bacteroidota bacterium]|nr:polyprenyl synthetase family protein [Bacteroidota bacterium]